MTTYREFEIAQGENIEGTFHYSPKRYLGQERSIPITLNGTNKQVAVEKLIQAAFAYLIKLTENYRDRHQQKCSVGRFNAANDNTAIALADSRQRFGVIVGVIPSQLSGSFI